MTLPAEIDSGDGRRFGLREANPGDMLDLIEAAGTASSSSAWMRYALMICSVTAIDGKPVMMPVVKEAVRDLGRRIGNTGMDALSKVHYPDEDTDAKLAASELDTAKN
ncbi:hypothetical protein [Lichenicola sp.]|uniref:hypothetical protein n=1 Tax=Lichenicola sp. TaxID=2804529 RepID=UPI003B001750